jgi:6-phosphofructokinase
VVLDRVIECGGSGPPRKDRSGGAYEIETETGIATRSESLGRVLCGETPVATDRVLATEFGGLAIVLLMVGEWNRPLVTKGTTINHIPLENAEGKQRQVPLDLPLLRAARSVGIRFSD